MDAKRSRQVHAMSGWMSASMSSPCPRKCPRRVRVDGRKSPRTVHRLAITNPQNVRRQSAVAWSRARESEADYVSPVVASMYCSPHPAPLHIAPAARLRVFASMILRTKSFSLRKCKHWYANQKRFQVGLRDSAIVEQRRSK
jgi:hypothetical protein